MPELTQEELDALPAGTQLYIISEDNELVLPAANFDNNRTDWNARVGYFLTKQEAIKQAELNRVINKLKG